ncbi:hypothetical protein J7M22_18635 [Candidatus Poribacteria bacterium]|nr:hypothetical protein [Candidatus Poribacteria bacterium]
MKKRFTLILEGIPLSPLHISGPGESLPLIDRCIQVDHRGIPLIPASSLRGRIRAHLERLARSFGHPICTPPRPDLTCPHNPHVPPPCLACRIFGSNWFRSEISFTDMIPISYPEAPPPPWYRTGVGINRYTGTVREERLFVTQVLPAKEMLLRCEIEGELEEEELGWLIAACRTVNHIGGEKARGMGRIELKVKSLLIAHPEGEREEEWERFIRIALEKEVEGDRA